MNAAQLIRAWGFDLRVLDDGRIEISPYSKLDDELRRWIVRNRQALIRNVQAADSVEIEEVKPEQLGRMH